MADIRQSAHNPAASSAELQRQLQAEQITPSEYRTAYRTVEPLLPAGQLCASGDRRLATAKLGRMYYCSACWLRLKGGRP